MSRPGEGEPSRRTVIERVRLLQSSHGNGQRATLIVDGDGEWVLLSLDATTRTTVRLDAAQSEALRGALGRAA